MNLRYHKQVDPNYGAFWYFSSDSLSDAEYDRLKPIMEHLGGHWREKVKSFVFAKDVSKELDYYLMNGVSVSEQYKWQEETQFYPTPVTVAQRVVYLAEIQNGNTVLEPSAGRGGLIDCITTTCDIFCVEPMRENFDILKSKGYQVVQETFESFLDKMDDKKEYPEKFDRVVMNPPFSNQFGVHNYPKKYNRVVMNPPFSEQRDIKHVRMAYKLLKPGGILVAIMSENALYYKTNETRNFKEFLKRHQHYIEAVPYGSFEESGTTIETIILKLVKN